MKKMQKVRPLTLKRETVSLLLVTSAAHPRYSQAPCYPSSPPATCPPA